MAEQIRDGLRIPQMRQLPLIEDAMGRQALALPATLNAECDNAEQLGQAAIDAFTQHPDHQVITSFPGMGDLSGARLLAEIGDDRSRFADARGLKAYAGSAPVTRASGRSIAITRRTIKNDRLNTVGFLCAFAAIPAQGPASSTTTIAVPAATATPPRYVTCSTAYSANSTTAFRPAKPTIRSKPSDPNRDPRGRRRLTLNKIGGLDAPASASTPY